MKPYIDPLDEYERISRNQPRADIPKNYPRVTDGTTSSIVKKTPRRIIQQLPTGRVVSDTEDWLPIMASFIYTNEIIPNANEQYALIQKCWMMVDRAMSYGCSHSLVPFTHRGNYIGTDLNVPYIKNVLFEPGKLSDSDSNCMFIEAWYQPADIDAIIKQEKELAASAKERGEKYESTWKIKELEEIKTSTQAKTEDEESSHSVAKDNADTKDGVKLVHCFQRGKGAEFFTIHPTSEKIVRVKKNKDPRGEMPVQTMYFETDGINPLGRGLIEQVAPLQNLMDAEMQMYQYNRALMLNPPIEKRGNFSKNTIKFAPNEIWDLGMDPAASATPVKIDSTAIANFPNNYGLMKSQLLNLAASPDTSISATVGNPGFSKTHAGVEQQAANVSVDDNYIRKQFESWFEKWSETAINLYFAERTGVEEIQVDKDTANKLRKLDPSLVTKDNIVTIDFDTATEALKFEVDASTSNMKNDAQQLEALDGLLGRLEKSTVLQGVIPPKKIVGAWNSIVTASGVENPEELSVSEEELQEQEQQQQMMAEQQLAQEQAMMQPEMPMEEQMPVEEAPIEAPIEEPVESEVDPEDLAFMTALIDMGYTDNQVQMAMALTERPDLADEEIIEMLGEPQDV